MGESLSRVIYDAARVQVPVVVILMSSEVALEAPSGVCEDVLGRLVVRRTVVIILRRSTFILKMYLPRPRVSSRHTPLVYGF